jgi:hypothetical protein
MASVTPRVQRVVKVVVSVPPSVTGLLPAMGTRRNATCVERKRVTRDPVGFVRDDPRG